MEKTSAPTIRNANLDFAKLVLAAMVVGLHARLLQDTRPELGHLLVNGLFRVAVPVFLIVNGFYLHDAISQGRFLNWLKRVLKLYAFWMVIYAPFWILRDGSFSPINALHKVLFGYHHLWYLIGIAGGGFVLWITQSLNRRAVTSLAVAAFLTGVGLQYLGASDALPERLDRLLDHNWVHRNFLFLGFPFMYLGMTLRACRHFEGLKNFALPALAMGILLLILEAHLNYRHFAQADSFDNLLSLAIACPAIFLAAFLVRVKANGKLLSSLSSGIYFTHPLVMSSIEAGLTKTHLLFVTTLFFSALVSLPLVRLSRRYSFIL